MSPKYLFFIAFGTLILSGCGLDTDEETVVDSGTTTVTVDVDQNAYLPLTNATSFFYTETGSGTPGGVEGKVSYDVGMSNSKGYSVYKVTLTGGATDLNLYFRTTSSQVQLLGMDGPVAVTSGISVDHLRFTTPVNMIGTQSAVTVAATADLSGDINKDDAGLTLTYDLTNNTTLKFENNGYVLPTLKASMDVDISVNGLPGNPVPITLNFLFTTGLGLVQHSAAFNNSSSNAYELKFHALEDLPNVMNFSHDGNAVNSTFTLAGSNADISSDDYDIVNQTQLDSLGWLTITAESNGTYSAAVITSNSNLPTDLTSVQVLFESQYGSGERLSANVTIQAPIPAP